MSIGFFVPTSKDLWLVPFAPLWQKMQTIPLRDRLAELVDFALEDGLAALLGCCQLSIGKTPTIWTRRKGADIDDEIGQGKVVIILGAPEVLFRAWATLGRKIGIAAVPFVGLGVFDVFEEAIVDDIAAEAIRLQIPLQSVEG